MKDRRWRGREGVVIVRTGGPTRYRDYSKWTAFAGSMALILALSATRCRAAEAKETGTAPVGEVASLIKPPETIEALSKLKQDVAAELARLQPTTQPAASGPTTQPSSADVARETAVGLYLSLQQLEQKIDLQMSLRKQIDDLKAPERIEAFARELAATQQRIKELESRIADPPPYVSEEDLKKAEAEYEEKNREINSRVALQTDRAKSVANAAQRRTDAAAAVQKAQLAFEEERSGLRAQLDAARTEEDRHRASQMIRRAEVDASLPLFDEVQVKLIEERDAILQGQEDRRIPALRSLVAKLGDFKNLLQRIRSRSEREQFTAQLEFAKRHPDLSSPFEVAFWQLRLTEVAAREELDKREREIQQRFPESDAADLEQDLAAEKASWTLFMDSVERRPSDQIRDRYRKVQASVESWRRKLAQLRNLLDTSVDRQQEIVGVIDDFDERIRAGEKLLNERLDSYLAEHPEDAQAQQVSQEWVQVKGRYNDKAQAMRTDLADLISRLQTAAGLVESFVDELGQHRSRLYWQYLAVPGRAIWSQRFGTVSAEWKAEQDKRSAVTTALLEEYGDFSRRDWVILLLVLLAAEGVALVAWRRARYHVDAITERLGAAQPAAEEERASITDRLHLFVVRCVARAAPVCFPAAAALILVLFLGLRNVAARVTLTVLIFLLAVVMAEAVIRALFLPGRPRQRLLRCSNVVAAHWRRWAMALWGAGLVLSAGPLLLWSCDWVYSTRSILWSLLRIVSLGIILAFGARKQLVMRVVGRPEQVQHPSLYWLISAAYPFLWTSVAALMVLELIGFGAIVSYLLTGSAATLATLVVAICLVRYFSALLTRWQQGMVSAEAEGSAAEQPEGLAASALALDAVKTVLRWGVTVATVLLIMRYWGITTVEIRALLSYEVIGADVSSGRSAITLGRILVAILSLLAAWWASRGLRSFLNTRVYPGYAGLDRGSRAAINTLLHYFVLLLGLYFALYAMRVPLGALTVVLGTLGLGVGLGLQPLFINFVSGLMILFERHVRIGDLIVVNGELGEVTSISMRSTAMRTPDGIELVIPNSELITQNVINWTLQDTRLRARVPVGVAYGTNVELVKSLLFDIVRKHPMVLQQPPPEVWFMSFGESSLDFEMVAWFRNALERWRFMTSIRYEIVRVLQEHGIEIPFPQRTLSILGNNPLRVQVMRDGKSGYAAIERDDLSDATPSPRSK